MLSTTNGFHCSYTFFKKNLKKPESVLQNGIYDPASSQTNGQSSSTVYCWYIWSAAVRQGFTQGSLLLLSRDTKDWTSGSLLETGSSPWRYVPSLQEEDKMFITSGLKHTHSKGVRLKLALTDEQQCMFMIMFYLSPPKSLYRCHNFFLMGEITQHR